MKTKKTFPMRIDLASRGLDKTLWFLEAHSQE
jgi:hypothetical protein